MACLEFAIEVNANRVPIVLGMGGNDTRTLVDHIKKTDFSNVSAILSVTPYYNKPSQKGLYAHYKAVAEASPVPVILYNVPGRTGIAIHGGVDSTDTSGCLLPAEKFIHDSNSDNYTTIGTQKKKKELFDFFNRYGKNGIKINIGL